MQARVEITEIASSWSVVLVPRHSYSFRDEQSVELAEKHFPGLNKEIENTDSATQPRNSEQHVDEYQRQPSGMNDFWGQEGRYDQTGMMSTSPY
ncbi:hypothetical protein PM082_014272 [Marasmius tenuissimus]|nr:hypothetical protein PM082_014272 [Marasmius tenuissimus]